MIGLMDWIGLHGLDWIGWIGLDGLDWIGWIGFLWKFMQFYEYL
jgi:hypothetical protein